MVVLKFYFPTSELKILKVKIKTKAQLYKKSDKVG